ncbi:MAG TPA: VTT domain-containing protein [Smithellaceae bacterium]|jgi:uncharacterized membrane protein YdjX (TVP38/TMEM64 family)|nr:VTT domain-containing protein [Smithellaceae bacterium]
MKKIKILQYTVLILTIVLLLVGSFAGYRAGYTLEDIWAAVSGSVLYSVLAVLGLYCLKTILWVIPINALYLGAGILFPVWQAVLITYIGLVFDFTIGFFAGRRIGKTSVMEVLYKKKPVQWLFALAEKNHAVGCLMIRMLPGPPTEITNMFYGATSIRYFYFLAASTLGMTPGMLPIIFMGKAVLTPFSKEFIIPFFIELVFVVLAFIIFFVVRKKGTAAEKDGTDNDV